jgi:1-acyl-sn-glycerol-3-phosphate acyltransferase
MNPRRLRTIAAAAVTLAVVAASVLLAHRLDLRADVNSLLPRNDPEVRGYRLLLEHFRVMDPLYIDVGPRAGASIDRQTVAAAADAVHAGMLDSGLFGRVVYRHAPEQYARLSGQLRSAVPALIGAEELEATERRLETAELEDRLERIKRTLLEPDGLILGHELLRDPLGMTELVMDHAEVSGPRHRDAGVSDGRIWSSGGDRTLIIALPLAPASQADAAARVMGAVADAQSRARQVAGADEVAVRAIGGHRATLHNATLIRSDVRRTVLISVLGVLVIGFIGFRRFSCVLLMVVPGAFGIAASVVLMVTLHPSVSAIVIGCGAALVGLSVDYALHVLYRHEQHGGAGRSLRFAIVAAALTSAAALCCLLFSRLPGLQEMGLFAALGLVVAALHSVGLLSQLMPSAQPTGRRALLPLGQAARWWLGFRQRHEGVVLAVMGLLIIAAVMGLFQVRIDPDIARMGHLSDEHRADQRHFQQTWGDEPSTSIVVRGRTIEDALIANDALYERLQRLKADGHLDAVGSVAPLLPSQRTQHQNSARFQAFWSAQRRDSLRQTMAPMLRSLKFSPEALDPFFESLQDPPFYVTPDVYSDTALGTWIESRIARDRDEVMILTTVSLADSAALAELEQAAHAVQREAMVMNGRKLVDHITDLIRGELGKLMVLGLVVVALCLRLIYGRVELMLLAILPVCAAVALTLGTLGLIGMPINLFSVLILLIVFGLGVDYSVYLVSSGLDAFRGHPPEHAATLGAVQLSALTSLWGFGALIFADHPALVSLGVSGIVGLAASYLVAMTITPALTARLLRPQRRHGAPSARHLVCMVGLYAGVTAAGLLYLTLVRPAVYLRWRRDRLARQRASRRFIRWVARTTVRHYPYGQRRLPDVGAEQLNTPAVIVANHTTTMDIFLVLCLPCDLVMVIKRWVWRTPIAGTLVRDAGFIFAVPGEADQTLADAGNHLRQGVSVMFFPEGTRRDGRQLGRFYLGAFKLAVEEGVDVLPVVLAVTEGTWPRHTWWINDHGVSVRVLDRIAPGAVEGGPRALATLARQRIADQIEDGRRAALTWPNQRRLVQTLYNYHGAFVERYVQWKLRLDPIYRNLDAIVPRDGLVIDAGCGYGISTVILARGGPRRQVVGVDRDPKKLRVARRVSAGFANVRYLESDLLEWEPEDAEAVLLIDVLHYWSLDSQRAIMERLARRLRPGGTMVFRDGCADGTAGACMLRFGERVATATRLHRPGDGAFFGSRSFYIALFAELGMELVEEKERWGAGSNRVFVLRKTGP